MIRSRRKYLDSLTPAESPRWHGDPVTPEDAAAALERAVESKWDAHRAHRAVRTQAIAALSEHGLSAREIARRLNISKSLVTKQLTKPHYRSEAIDQILDADRCDRGERTRKLIARAWNGAWHPESDPEFGIAPSPDQHRDR